MCTTNQMNTLYFYPHRPHFCPAPDAACNKDRYHRFPDHDVPAASTWARAANSPVGDSRVSERDQQEVNGVRMDDDGTPTRALGAAIGQGIQLLKP